jgi:acyl carrier protein
MAPGKVDPSGTGAMSSALWGSTLPLNRASPGKEKAVAAGFSQHPNEAEIRAWLISYLSDLLEIDPSEIDTKDPLASYGLDSSGAVGMVADLGSWLDLRLDPEVLYSHPTIDALTRYLADERGR